MGNFLFLGGGSSAFEIVAQLDGSEAQLGEVFIGLAFFIAILLVYRYVQQASRK